MSRKFYNLLNLGIFIEAWDFTSYRESVHGIMDDGILGIKSEKNIVME